MTDYMKEAKRLAVHLTHAAGTGDRDAEASLLAALLAHIQRGAVPEGWQLDGSEVALLHHLISPDDDGEHPPVTLRAGDVRMDEGTVTFGLLCEYTDYPDEGATLLVECTETAPDQFRNAAKMAPVHCTPTEHDGRIVYEHTSEPIPNADGFVLYAAPAPDRFRAAAKMMAVQPACMTCSGHGMVGGLLPNGGGYQADPCPDCAAPVTAGVPMPEPVAYGFVNTAITGHTNRLMMVRLDVPFDDQYAGAYWLPLVLADEAHTYGVACRAAGEAAGYAQGLRDAVRDAEIEALRLYARALCKAVDAATDFIGTVAGGASWWDDVWADHAAALDRARERISQAALRGEVK